jgi:hypothetical protein
MKSLTNREGALIRIKATGGMPCALSLVGAGLIVGPKFKLFLLFTYVLTAIRYLSRQTDHFVLQTFRKRTAVLDLVELGTQCARNVVRCWSPPWNVGGNRKFPSVFPVAAGGVRMSHTLSPKLGLGQELILVARKRGNTHVFTLERVVLQAKSCESLEWQFTFRRDDVLSHSESPCCSQVWSELGWGGTFRRGPPSMEGGHGAFDQLRTRKADHDGKEERAASFPKYVRVSESTKPLSADYLAAALAARCEQDSGITSTLAALLERTVPAMSPASKLQTGCSIASSANLPLGQERLGLSAFELYGNEVLL